MHLLVSSACEVGFQWGPSIVGWSRPGLFVVSNLAGPVQHFEAVVLDAWRTRVVPDLCDREGFLGYLLLDIHGSLQLLNSSHAKKGIRPCSGVSWLVVSGMATSWAGSEVSLYLADFVVLLIVMVTFLGECTSSC